MTRHSVLLVVGRMTAAFILSAVLLHMFPSLLYKLTIPFVDLFSEWLCPYVRDISMSVDGIAVTIKGVITLDMTMADGSPLLPVPATWQHSNIMLMNVSVIAVAVWAAPACKLRTRLIALPFTLLTAVFACSYLLAFDVQEAALKFIGEEWLMTLSLGSTQANVDYFEKIQSRYLTVKWVESIHDGGGIYFLGILAGLIGYAVVRLFKKKDVPTDGS